MNFQRFKDILAGGVLGASIGNVISLTCLALIYTGVGLYGGIAEGDWSLFKDQIPENFKKRIIMDIWEFNLAVGSVGALFGLLGLGDDLRNLNSEIGVEIEEGELEALIADQQKSLTVYRDICVSPMDTALRDFEEEDKEWTLNDATSSDYDSDSSASENNDHRSNHRSNYNLRPRI